MVIVDAQWHLLSILHRRTVFYQPRCYTETGKSLTGTYSKNLNHCFKLLGYFFNWRSCGKTRINLICCLTKQSIYNRVLYTLMFLTLWVLKLKDHHFASSLEVWKTQISESLLLIWPLLRSIYNTDKKITTKPYNSNFPKGLTPVYTL